MRDEHKTKKQLLDELETLRQQMARLKAEHSQVQEARQENDRARREKRKASAQAPREGGGLDNLFEGIPIGYYQSTPAGQIVKVNPTLVEILGYPDQDTLLAMNSVEIYMDPGERSRWQKAMDSEETMSGFETRWRRYDGTAIWVRESAHTIRDDAGQVLYYEGVIEDITERKRAEEALRESEEKFRSLAEQSPNMIFINQRGRVVYANEKCEEIMGYTRQEFYSETFDFIGITAPEYVDRLKANYARHMRGEEAEPYDYAVITKDGRRIVAILATKLIDYGGEKAILGVITDITERKQAEEMLRFTQFAIDRIAETAFWMGPDGRFIYVNDAACRNLGYSREELLTMGVHDVNPDLIPEDWPKRWKLVKERSAHTVESRQRTKDGRIFPVEITANFLEFEGKEYNCAFIRDITERKQLEEQLLQQERLAAVGQLAGGIAHDFNNLLTAIMLYAQMPLGRANLPPEAARSLETILEESRQAAELVQQILDFSRRSPIETHPVDLKPFVREAMRVLQRTIPEHISPLLEIEAGEYVVNADPTRIQQVLMNIVLNARDAMPEGGTLRIRLARTDVIPGEVPPLSEMTAGAWVCLSISDTGTGIHPHVLPHVFEPFFTTKPEGAGAGLGLAQVYGIVKQHGGHIGVETELEKGTTFYIYLPAYHTEGECKKDLTEPPTPEGTGETILLVEDNEHIREGGRAILELLGYQVLAAADGRQALELYHTAGHVDLVLTDIVMPEMGGRELIRELRKENPNLKAAAITGHLLTEDLQALKQEGLHDIIRKPFDVHVLAQVIHRILEEDAR